mgnify:CR=1 FL=1
MSILSIAGLAVGYIIIGLIMSYVAHWVIRDGNDEKSIVAGMYWPLFSLMCIFMSIFMLGRFLLAGVPRLFNWIDSWVASATRRIIQSDAHGELWQGAGHAEPWKWVKVSDETGMHWVRVDPDVHTAKEGVAWSYGMEGDDYDPSVRK